MKKDFISNVGGYIEDSLSKIKGFDIDWITMISSKPLLFEDVDYLRITYAVDNTITEEELEAYKNGQLRELYATFENMLMCNIENWDRIIRFCTLNMFGYVRIDDQKVSQHTKKVVLNFSMTPTQIWCGALCNQSSTSWELQHGWGMKLKPGGIEDNFNILKNNKNFDIFIKYSAYVNNTSGFRNTLLVDKTSNKRLSQICHKFTNQSAVTSTEQLDTIFKYNEYIEDNVKSLYDSLDRCLSKIYNGDSSQYAIYVYSDEFWIHTSRFSMKVNRSHDGRLTKDYVSNSYECFAAEQYLVKSTKQQIEWSKNIQPLEFDYDKNILEMLLLNMLYGNFRDVMCIKRMNKKSEMVESTTSVITFSGVFNNLYIDEKFMFDNHCIKTVTKCLSKENTAKYIINRGYVIFGATSDVMDLIKIVDENGGNLTKQMIVEHYSHNCVNILDYMEDVIEANIVLKNDIIDFVLGDNKPKMNQLETDNKHVKFTNIRGITNVRNISKYIKSKNKSRGQTYWQTVENWN